MVNVTEYGCLTFGLFPSLARLGGSLRIPPEGSISRARGLDGREGAGRWLRLGAPFCGHSRVGTDLSSSRLNNYWKRGPKFIIQL